MNVVVKIERADGVIVAAPGALQRPCANQELVARCQTAEERPDREDHQAARKHAPAADDVRKPPAEQHEATKDERVGAHDPLQVLLREAQVKLDRRQRNIHDRDVEHDHELGRHDHRQRDPATTVLPSDCCFCHNFSAHLLGPPNR